MGNSIADLKRRALESAARSIAAPPSLAVVGEVVDVDGRGTIDQLEQPGATPPGANTLQHQNTPSTFLCPVCQAECRPCWSTIYEPEVLRCTDCDGPPKWEPGGRRFVSSWHNPLVADVWIFGQSVKETWATEHAERRATQPLGEKAAPLPLAVASAIVGDGGVEGLSGAALLSLTRTNHERHEP